MIYNKPSIWFIAGFIGGSDGKESTCSSGDPGLIPGSGRSPGEGNGYPGQYSCLENSILQVITIINLVHYEI